jgi:electron-transferring-flavoprotein dehydrogenase
MFLPKEVHNQGNYVMSLGEFTKWLSTKAEDAGVEILTGIAGDKILWNDNGSIGGVITGD